MKFEVQIDTICDGWVPFGHVVDYNDLLGQFSSASEANEALFLFLLDRQDEYHPTELRVVMV